MDTKFIELMADVLELEPEDLNEGSKFKELVDFDSLCVLSTVAIFSDEYGKTITSEDINGCETLADLHGLLN